VTPRQPYAYDWWRGVRQMLGIIRNGRYADGMPGSQDAPVLAQERETFAAHRAELLSETPGMYALVHEDEIAGAFDTEMDAVRVGYRLFGNVPFLVQKIEPADTAECFFSSLMEL